MSDYAIDTAARFGEIPFVEFTKELVTGVFDSLVEAHMAQMEQYSDFVNSLTQDLSTYINNTMDGVSFDQISDFVLNYDLPQLSDTALKEVLDKLSNPTATSPSSDAPQGGTPPADKTQWWGGLINALAPAVTGLVGKINDPTLGPKLEAVATYNSTVVSALPSYQQIHDSIAALISSNKYALLQNMARQGAMRLVVTEGEIETKLTFSTWNTHEDSQSTTLRDRIADLNRTKQRGGASAAFKRVRKTQATRHVTVNTAKSYQRDTSGTKVDIFGRVLIRFKTDYAPLNG
ncbi:MAG: hypothetical protein JNJ46_28345 [Myxococcales bacterium]|nr:hypothetical protein [Myxococcales bacterium]